MDGLAALRSRLPEGVVSTHPGETQSRSRDWWPLAMLREARGEIPTRPAAVVFPRTTEAVAEVLAWADETGTAVVPRGAGSGVCGGAQALRGAVVVDVSRMDRIISVDEESACVEVQAGIRGTRLEEGLEPYGLTTGHYPQSLAISSVGGWIAARSAGQASAGYGVIEDLVLGLVVVLAGGEVVTLRSLPRSAAGPDLRELFLGSEGTLGIVTEATLVASRRPVGLRWLAFRPRGFDEAIVLAREVERSGARLLVLRAYDDADAAVTFGGLDHPGGPVMIVAAARDRWLDATLEAVRDVARERGADPLPDEYGRHWWEHRFDAVRLYRRVMGEERLLGHGVVVDTMEVAGLWSRLGRLYAEVSGALSRHAEAVGCHLSHPYRSGASLYFTFLLRAPDDARAEEPYRACWTDAAAACHAAGGTVTHHHGVGILKAPFLEEELGTPGIGLLRRVKDALDPRGVLNPGKLLPPR
ncbi:MAG TPA: FAD-binding oxidoreductase [Actinomycetota bacterium]|nr:FAD-binding oxidoreductase [Actinomycetota bacterium]